MWLHCSEREHRQDRGGGAEEVRGHQREPRHDPQLPGQTDISINPIEDRRYRMVESNRRRKNFESFCGQKVGPYFELFNNVYENFNC